MNRVLSDCIPQVRVVLRDWPRCKLAKSVLNPVAVAEATEIRAGLPGGPHGGISPVFSKRPAWQ
jgi:hypothetical protein